METHAGKRYVIFGGSGFLGQNLVRALHAVGASATVVSRTRPHLADDWHPWDGHTLDAWQAALPSAHGIINLAGRTVDCIKSPENCDQILRSRVESTRAIGRALHACHARPTVWLQMSTAHLYGDSLDRICDEDSAFGYGLAPTVGAAWEQACRESCPPDIRIMYLRTSFVLGRSGGALHRMAGLARWGLGGTIGHGRQGISWIHERDMDDIVLRGLADPNLEGPYLVTAPNPVSNRVFMQALRRALRMPIGLPAPTFGVQLAAPWLLRTDPELALCGRYCVPKRLLDAGHHFAFDDIATALTDLFQPKR